MKIVNTSRGSRDAERDAWEVVAAATIKTEWWGRILLLDIALIILGGLHVEMRAPRR